MRILHTSDWHLGRILHERSLLPDQARFLDDLRALLARDPHDALVIAGDLYDRSVPPEDAVGLFSRFLRDLRAACPALPVVVIAGNHDSATRVAYGAELFALAGIHVRGGGGAIEEPVLLRDASGAEAELWPIPFLWPGELSAHRDGDDVPLGSQVEALEEAVRRAQERRTDGRAQILVAHCFAAGATVSESERTLVGLATQIDAAIFARFDYVALGHLHRPQRVTANTWYSGSPLKYSFSEADGEKALLSVDVTAGAPPVVRRIPIVPLRDMAILRGTFRSLLDDPAHVAWRDHYLRIELLEPEVVDQPVAHLRARFPHLLDFRMPEPFAHDASATSAAGPSDERRDLEADFLDFERRIRGGDPSLDLLDAFRRLRAKLDASEAAR